MVLLEKKINELKKIKDDFDWRKEKILGFNAAQARPSLFYFHVFRVNERKSEKYNRVIRKI